MEPLSLAVIGAGMMGERYARVLAQLPHTRVAAVCDVVPETARRVAHTVGAVAYTDYRRLLETEKEVHAVCVCTSDQAHREPCEAAAALGKHILVEKPLAVSVEDGEAIVHAARAAGVKLMVGHILRFDPRYVRAWQMVRDGRIGEPVHAYARRNNILASGRRLGGRTSVLYFLGIHDVDFLLWTLQDRPTRVYAAASRKVLADLDVDDSAFLTLHFAGGAIACVECSWVIPNRAMASLDARVEIVGTGGAVYVDVNGEGLTEVDSEKLGRADTFYASELHGRLTGIIRDEIEHFVTCVLEDREPLIPGEEALNAVRVVAAAHRSLASGLPEAVV
jgi:predicted dehydrogenase